MDGSNDEKNGKKLAANFANCLYDWEKQYDELKVFRNHNAKRLPGGGKNQ